ncbi:MAG: DUF1838 family protein [Gammaproteobacteria bacterium]|jgi:hypothetical protein|nr:DUF1838 family protein [Gammaproteobacteria bacterium]
MADTLTGTTRRRLLQGLTLSSFGLASLSTEAQADSAAPDLTEPADLLAASIKMRGSLDERLAFIWMRGTRYTLVNGEALPLCGYLGGSITRYRQLADDAYEFLLYEISYYTDLETGEVLQTLRMPYVDREVDVPLYRTGPGRHVVMLANEEELEWSAKKTTGEELARQLAPDAKIYYRFNLRPAVTFRDQVWIRSDSFTRLVPRDTAQPGMFYKEAITYQASQAELARAGSVQVDSLLSFAISTAWRPWMQMGGIDGHTTTDGIGGKELSMAAMPADFLRFTEAFHPDVLDDPAALLKL